MKLNKKNIILLIILLILSFFITILFYSNKDDDNNISSVKYSLLSDYSRFYTINSCLSKYISYVNISDTNNIINLLNSDYVANNGINSNNLYNFVERFDLEYSYELNKVYYESINKNNIKYYTKGYLYEDSINGVSTDEKNVYYIVYFDLVNDTFSIEPYDGSIFNGE